MTKLLCKLESTVDFKGNVWLYVGPNHVIPQILMFSYLKIFGKKYYTLNDCSRETSVLFPEGAVIKCFVI